MSNQKKLLKKRATKFLSNFGDNLKAKFKNLCGKTGQYSVPSELYQKRTSRSNRSLISWRTVKNNRLSIEQLNSFEGGVTVEFLNNDFFDTNNHGDELFNQLKLRLGSDENVSSIITIRSEEGSSSSKIQREAFKTLVNNTEVTYKGESFIINETNYMDFALKQNIKGGKGNEKWSGFLFVSIKGGQQNKIETHKGPKLTLFNPACDYASEDVCDDITLVMQYYALKSIDEALLKENDEDKWIKLKFLVRSIQDTLKIIEYDNETFSGNLLDYVMNSIPLSVIENQLTDPIQFKKINIDNFNITARTPDSVDFTHDEAVLKDRFYWDKKKQTILSPTRPNNVFWSFHESNMMQQDYTLNEFYALEDERYIKRHNLLKKISNSK